MPGCTEFWHFFLKFAERGYSKTPAEFLFDILKLDMPNFSLKATPIQTDEQFDVETDVRKYIKNDERILRRLHIAVDTLLVRIFTRLKTKYNHLQVDN